MKRPEVEQIQLRLDSGTDTQKDVQDLLDWIKFLEGDQNRYKEFFHKVETIAERLRTDIGKINGTTGS